MMGPTESFAEPLDGRYLVRASMGAGGHGLVFLAEDLKLARQVALKVLPPDLRRSQESLARIEREARIGGMISHPNVCGVTDVGRLADGSTYFVMEALHGESLAVRRTRGPLPEGAIIEIVDQLLSGLHAAHERGVIHRDVTPGNVFLVDLGAGRSLVKLLDFGVAQLLGSTADSARLTDAGRVVGTIRYMAPEQVRGRRDVDRRVDLYAAAVLLFEGLSNEHPFGELSSQAMIEAIAFQRPRSIRTCAPNVPVHLASVIDRALAPERERRFGNAQELRAALRGHDGDAPPDTSRTVSGGPIIETTAVDVVVPGSRPPPSRTR